MSNQHSSLRSGAVRTLIVYLHGIGDNIMLSGVLKAYKQQHQSEIIDLIVLNSGCAAIWNNNPHINSVRIYPASQPHFWNTPLFYLVHRRRVQKYIKEVNARAIYSKIHFPTIQTLPEIIYHVSGSYGRHKVDRIAKDLGVPIKPYPYDLYPGPADIKEAQEQLAALGEGRQYAVLHPFSGHKKKKLSPKSVGTLLKILETNGFTTLVVGAPSERDQVDPDWQTRYAFGLSFGTLSEILKRAAVFVGTDSCIAHVAGFANTRKIVVLSPKLEPSRYLPISGSEVHCVRIRSSAESNVIAEIKAALGAPRQS
jgi:ADP-heptose:LPS heptosyltransferase